MDKKFWYAVMRDSDDTDWGTGSYNYEEALEMVHQYIQDGGYIAVIEECDDPICVEEIREF